MGRAVVVAWALLATNACTYPEFDFREPDSSASGDSAGGDSETIDAALDATSDVEIDSSVDTSVDSAIVDVAPEAPPKVGCDGVTAFFCDDFDSASSPTDKWMGSSEVAGGTITLITSGAFSAPKAVLSKIPTGPAGMTVGNMGQTVNAPSATALTRFDMRIYFEDATYGGDSASVLKIQRGGGHGVGLVAQKTGLAVEVYGDSYDLYPIAAVPSGKWVHLRLDCTLKNSGGMYKLFIDDMSTPVSEGSSLSTVDVEGTDRAMIIGLYSELATTAYGVRFDDVIVDFP